MSKIAVLGLGAMGSRMAQHLIRAGHQITVWNRTPAVAEPLVAQGAKQAFTPKAAVADAEFVIAMLRDDEVSRQVWLDPENGALAGMTVGTVAIESSTLTPDWISELGAVLAAQDISLLEAPVSGSRPQADAAQLVYLVGGDSQVLEQCRPFLAVMSSAIHHVGGLGHGALVKLATNALLGIQVTALAEIIGMLQRNGADASKAISAMSTTTVWAPAANYYTSTMLNDNFAPLFPVELIEKDFNYAIAAAGSAEKAPTISAARDVFRQALAQDLGKENMTSVAKLFRK